MDVGRAILHLDLAHDALDAEPVGLQQVQRDRARKGLGGERERDGEAHAVRAEAGEFIVEPVPPVGIEQA